MSALFDNTDGVFSIYTSDGITSLVTEESPIHNQSLPEDILLINSLSLTDGNSTLEDTLKKYSSAHIGRKVVQSINSIITIESGSNNEYMSFISSGTYEHEFVCLVRETIERISEDNPHISISLLIPEVISRLDSLYIDYKQSHKDLGSIYQNNQYHSYINIALGIACNNKDMKKLLHDYVTQKNQSNPISEDESLNTETQSRVKQFQYVPFETDDKEPENCCVQCKALCVVQ